MNHLYAPWRDNYYASHEEGKQERIPASVCIFCKQHGENNDEKFWIFRRFKHHAIILNKFPYNVGHLLIVPLEHCAELEKLSPAARVELIELMAHCCTILKKVLKAEGINSGINLGSIAGAGIPSHLHMHVVPRWQRDTHFMPVIAEAKVISVDFNKTFAQLKPSFDALNLNA
jgi:ATP adenylyltransferase